MSSDEGFLSNLVMTRRTGGEQGVSMNTAPWPSGSGGQGGEGRGSHSFYDKGRGSCRALSFSTE